MRILSWCGLGLLAAGLNAGAVEMIRLDTTDVIRTIEHSPLGIDLNYLRDDDANLPPGAPKLSAVLKDLGVKWLRYPGGEKSDHYRFAAPPYDHAAPVVKSTRDGLYTKAAAGYDLLDFDEFIADAREIGAEPVVVVAYDSVSFSETPLDEFIEHAAAWVRYANITKKYNVRYWEIGNENWHPNSKNPIEQRSQDILKIAKAMRTVDPSIKLGSSGVDQTAGQELDFFTYSKYAAMPFSEYRNAVKPDFCGFKKAIPHQQNVDWTNKEVFAVEFNAVEFKPYDNWKHDVSHCIQLFDMMGQLLSNPHLDCAMLWNTRWIEEKKADEIWYLVDPLNALTPIGKIYSMWSKNLKPQMVRVYGPKQTRCFAMYDPNSKALSVMVINQAEEGRTVTFDSGKSFKIAEHQIFSGKNPDDTDAALTAEPEIKVDGNTEFFLPGTSANVITFKQE